MAHGLESRVPFLDHEVVELAATMPSNIKFKDGTMKYALRHAMQDILPPEIMARKDKMGFPVPLSDWSKKEARGFIQDVFSSRKARQRELINNRAVLDGLEKEEKYSRKIWGLLCLELWQQEFHDQHNKYKCLLKNRN
jgi:asparagine synthase (glutamine-hydrolysing)